MPDSRSPRESRRSLDPIARFQHLLAPLDGSQLAETVLPTVRLLARRLGARVTLLHVLEHEPPGKVHGEHHLQTEQEAAAYLEAIAADMSTDVPDVDWHVHPNPESDVAGSIAQHGDELGADLTVIATHGSGGMRGFFLGSIAQQILRIGDDPVLLARPGGMPLLGRRIAVPLDGDEEGEAAIPVARMLATSLDADLFLLSVIPKMRSLEGNQIATARFMPRATSELLDQTAGERGNYLQTIADQLESRERVTSAIYRGDVADEIARGVREQQADLVVMSTHAKHGIEAFISGSIAPRVVSQLRRPILMVRAG